MPHGVVALTVVEMANQDKLPICPVQVAPSFLLGGLQISSKENSWEFAIVVAIYTLTKQQAFWA